MRARGTLGVSRARFRASYAVMAILVVLVVVGSPTSYFLLSPGSAVDLGERVSVAGHAPARDHYYLTDVSLRRANVGMLLAKFVPGFRLVPEAVLVPAGVTPKRYDEILVRAMDSSQDVAAIVAERAAGLPVVVPRANVVVASVLPASHARGLLESGDVLERAAGVDVRDVATLAGVLKRSHAGDRIAITIARRGRSLTRNVRTIERDGRAKLGIALELDRPKSTLPVKVTYAMGDVAGSSGGLMFALAIYGSLHPTFVTAKGLSQPAEHRIAGTGTIDLDGTVGPIEGTQQKLIAAKRAGARIFLVPRENYDDVKGDPDVRIVPVGSFREALAALRADGIG